MLRHYCPYCEEQREEEEFSCVGEAHRERPDDIMALSDEAFAEYLYFRKNPKGLHKEIWVHSTGCRKYFNVLRNTVNNQILLSYKMSTSIDENHLCVDMLKNEESIV